MNSRRGFLKIVAPVVVVGFIFGGKNILSRTINQQQRFFPVPTEAPANSASPLEYETFSSAGQYDF